jgi:hypothetical protein
MTTQVAPDSDEEIQQFSNTESKVSSVFKVNKESLEKDYNMVELLLKNYNQIEFNKLKGTKVIKHEDKDNIVGAQEGDDTTFYDMI